MKKYHLRYESQGNLSYTEWDAKDRRDIGEKPTDEFGRELEDKIINRTISN